MYLQASSSGVLLGVPEDESADAEAAEEEADGADAPVRAVLQAGANAAHINQNGDTALMKAALSHRGMAVIDVISPCVTFANNDESYSSYGYVKDHGEEGYSL